MERKAGFVAIIGRPNAGKSTLLNAILGSQISIVSPKPQTTRDRIQGILTEPQNGQIVFLDTPGIHRAKEGGINHFMVEEAKGALDSPDVIWYLVDPMSGSEHEKVVVEVLKTPRPSNTKLFVVFNKCDLKHIQPWTEGFLKALEKDGIRVDAHFWISALKGRFLDGLLQATWNALPIHPPFYPMEDDALSDRPMRFFVAEKIRETLFYCLGEELPYSCAVSISKFDDSRGRIEAVIHVERDSQKGMVVGQGGKKIKEIGTRARLAIEKLLEKKIFLGLQVKVDPEWTKNADAIKRMGYAFGTQPEQTL